MKNIFEQLTDLLKKDERLVSQDVILLKNQTQELARKNDPELVKLLLSDKATKQHFFFEVEKTLIFDKEKFIRFVSNKQFLPDSYTAFKNKIGLTAGDEYLSESKEVVLAWPYKDCVLEGGMTKEDQKREEIFYNETLAPDDINRLLDAKVFTNFKRIDKKGEHKLDGFKRDEKGAIKDNLIIKGNNLLALASLKKEFAGKVKLIYIDPPYNTGNDGFKYNDNFNHSTWLTFMKNRLEIARKLLRDDSVIFVQCDDNEQAYLKVLMDEVFGRENFVNTIAVKSSTPSGLKTTHREKTIIRQKDTIHFYSKNKTSIVIKSNYYKSNSWDKHYCYYLNRDELKLYRLNDILKNNNIDSLDINNIKFKEFYIKNSNNIFQTGKSMPEDIRKISLEEKNKDRVIPYGDNQFAYNGRRLSSLSSSLNFVWSKNGYELEISKLVTDFWEDIDFNNTQNEGGVSLQAGKKPEYLLQRIVDMTTKPNDIVLDFHLGSGTTCAVAHKMGRQYIGIEQMDYIETLAVERMKKVIQGEQGGISKSMNWQGGGDFVYMELAKWNEGWIEKIEKAKTNKELAKLWDEMKDTAFLSYKVDPKTVDANAKDFADLSVADQKKFLIECLDKNQLYVNLSEIEDKEYEVSKEDKARNKDFYNGK